MIARDAASLASAIAAAERELADIPRLLAGLPRRISDLAALGAARAPAAAAMREGSRAWSYGELAAAIERCATELAAAGVRGGDRVLVVGENCAAFVVVLLGTCALDAWAVPVNARLSTREIDAIRDHCAPRQVVYLADVSPDAASHAARHGATQAWEVSPMGRALLGRRNDDCRLEAVSEDSARQVAALLYTSGTTGRPKGVMLTHRNLLYIAKLASTLRVQVASDRVYGVLPMSHVYGLASVCLGTLFAGACLHLEARYSPQAMLRAITEDGITVLHGVPSMFAKVLDFARATGLALRAPSLRFCNAGGSPLTPALKADFERTFGVPLNNGYGLTEAAPTIAHTHLDAPREDCSVGMPLPGLELRIVDLRDPLHRGVRQGEAGELWVRGPNVMRGYYRDPALTEQTIDAEGWLNTGDIARRDPDGALFIVGRTKELIIHSGFNVYPVEVESVLNAHPAVMQSAVVGRVVEGNEDVVAFVELSPGTTATPGEIARFAAESLAPYKRPAEIVILPTLPVAATGKILKQQLRVMAAHLPAGVAAENNHVT
jgi:long-chain acyl-CoA synthetase